MDRRAVVRRGLLVGSLAFAGCNGLLDSSTDGSDGVTTQPHSNTRTPGSKANGIETALDTSFSVSSGVGGFEDLTVLDSGDYVLVGTRTSADGRASGWVLRADSQGRKRWSRTTDASALYGVTTTSNGDLLAVGRAGGSGGPVNAGWVHRFTPDGTTRWANAYDGGQHAVLKAGVPTANGFLLAGVHEITSRGGATGWLLELGSDGTVAGERVFDGGHYRVFNAIVRTGNGRFALVGSARETRDGDSSGLLVGIDGQRATRFRRRYTEATANVFRGAVASDGGVRCCGEVSTTPAESDENEDAWLLEAADGGTERWSTTRDRQHGDRLWDLAVAPDGSALAVGQTNVTGQGTQTGLVLAVAADGTIQHVRTLGNERGGDPDAITGVVRRPSGGYTATGVKNVTQSSAGYESSGWLLELGV
ncbi:MAG: hypothetical protein ABEI77_09880 [Halorientalis sp.]